MGNNGNKTATYCNILQQFNAHVFPMFQYGLGIFRWRSSWRPRCAFHFQGVFFGKCERQSQELERELEHAVQFQITFWPLYPIGGGSVTFDNMLGTFHSDAYLSCFFFLTRVLCLMWLEVEITWEATRVEWSLCCRVLILRFSQGSLLVNDMSFRSLHRRAPGTTGSAAARQPAELATEPATQLVER